MSVVFPIVGGLATLPASGPPGHPLESENMLDRALRPAKDRLLEPAARRLGGRVHPNALTVAGLAAGLAAAASLYGGAYSAGLALWMLNRLLDGLDGLVARRARARSDFGGYIDLLFDFVVYAAVPIGLAFGGGASPSVMAALALLLGSFYVNAASWMYLAALLEKRSAGAAARGEPTSVAMPEGLIEGTETIVFFTAFILLPHRLTPLFVAMGVLVLAGVAQRLTWAARHL